VRLAVIIAVALLLGAPARAAEPDDEFAVEEARRHHTRGTAYFKLGDFEQALGEFRAAYSLSQAPGLLFNMAQAARASRQYPVASHYYRAYLAAVPDAPERTYVEERLRDLALVVPSTAGLREPPERAEPEPAPPGPRRPAPVDEGGSTLRIAGIATGVGGVALAATAIYFGVQASRASDQVSSAFADGGTWGPELEALYADGRRDQRIATVSAVGAAALVVGGAVLWYVGEQQRTRVGVAPTRGGVAVEVSWGF